MALRYVAEILTNDPDIVLLAIENSKNGQAFQYASVPLKGDRNFVIKSCKVNGLTLEYTTSSLQADIHVVQTAITQNGLALQFAHDDVKDQKEIAIMAVTQNGSAFRYVDTTLQHDKDVVLAAVGNNPEMLKYALGGLSQDNDCWVAAGLWSKDQDEKLNRPDCQRVVLSTRFALREGSTSAATEFTLRLLENSYVWERFVVYSPNAFSKQTCDPNWTRMEWPCRGTFETCCMTKSELKRGKPQSDSCWRYSFRWHLEQAKKNNGFMIQVVDLDGDPGKLEFFRSVYVQGDGQKIETKMASEVGTKIFRVFRPRQFQKRFLHTTNVRQKLVEFDKSHIDMAVSRVDEWYRGNCVDMEDCEIKYDDQWAWDYGHPQG